MKLLMNIIITDKKSMSLFCCYCYCFEFFFLLFLLCHLLLVFPYLKMFVACRQVFYSNWPDTDPFRTRSLLLLLLVFVHNLQHWFMQAVISLKYTQADQSRKKHRHDVVCRVSRLSHTNSFQATNTHTHTHSAD